MPGLSLIGILWEGNMGGDREIPPPPQHSKLTANSLLDIANF